MARIWFGTSLVWFGYRRAPLFGEDKVHHYFSVLGFTIEWMTNAKRIP